jgi:hypothetical protein
LPAGHRAGDQFSEPNAVTAIKNHPASILASECNMAGGYDEAFRTNNLVACRWRHNQTEFGNVVAPAKILFLRLKPTRAWRLQGRKTEISAPLKDGLGLIAHGNDGSWRYLDDVDIIHIYITDAWLGEVSAAEGGPACVYFAG